MYNKGAYAKTLKRVAGVFSDDKHPEWRSKKDVIAWVNKSRQASERSFDNLKIN